ncbi:MAG: class I SAM-dependent methyltransferase [Gammaproteobacteria bacterium]|nr:class I SAM-dependent methyltransferase [Gammaproteobacteria bacterium]MDH5653889.1 class I SAM-dependent methyltransferase [Gammaproteobacteria bacterium]
MKVKSAQEMLHRCGTIQNSWRELAKWYQTPLGQTLLEVEKQQLDEILPSLFGYHLIQVGDIGSDSLLDASRISNCCVMDIEAGGDAHPANGPRFAGLPHALPLASESVDVVLLPHTLEFSPQPHAVLREVDRVLVPEGHLVMMMFNPWSLWQLQSLFLGWRQTPPWCGHFISTTRTRDWLALLGFNVKRCERYFYRPPSQAHKLMSRLDWLEKFGRAFWPIFGGSYILTARKRVETLTPIRPIWKTRKRVVAAGLVESMQPHSNNIIHLQRYRKLNGQG